MRIVFHGENAANFSVGFAGQLQPSDELAVLPDRVTSEADVAAFRTAEVLVATRFDDGLPIPSGLRLLQVPGAGYDGIRFAMLPIGCPVCNCFGHEQAIAEYVIGALLMRRIPFIDADRHLRQGRWAYQAGRAATTHPELAGSTIGILGFGHIGKAVAGCAKAFGMRVHVANRSVLPVSPSVDRGFPMDELSSFWSSADSFVVTLPLLPETKGLVDAEAFAAMPRHAVLVNVSRGPLVDEAALYEALAAGQIAGAVIDTWYDYPSADRPETLPSKLPFHELQNVLMTPHMSGWTDGTIRRRQAVIAENIARLRDGRPLLHVVNA